MSDNNVQAAQETPTAADKLFNGDAAQEVVKAPASAEQQASSDKKPDDNKTEAKVDAAKTDETKPPVDEKAAEVKYELKLPENSKLADSEVDKIVAIAKAQGLSQEAAQKLLDAQSDAVSQFETEKLTEFKETVEEWKSQAAKDPEYGGDNFPRNVELAKRVVTRFGSQEFATALEASGFGNHPELLRTFVRIGQAMGEDRVILNNSSQSSSKSLEDIFYGGKNK